MRKALKEYWNEVMVPSGRWSRRHWKGFMVYIVLCGLIGFGVPMVQLFWDEIKEFFINAKEKVFGRKEEEP